MKKKNWIYALIVTLIIIIAIVSMMIFLFKQNMEINQKKDPKV